MPDDKKTIVDVEEPGKSAPSATSKPVLVSNRPLLKDPMVVDDDKKDGADQPEEKPAKKPALNSADQVKLQPPEESKAEDAPSEPKSTIPTEAEAAAAKEAGEAAPTDANDIKQDKPAKKQAAEAAAAEASLKHQATITKLADSRQYVLPIKTVEQRRSRRTAIIGVVIALILILTWLDIALDAGIINLGGLSSLTHFFSN